MDGYVKAIELNFPAFLSSTREAGTGLIVRFHFERNREYHRHFPSKRVALKKKPAIHIQWPFRPVAARGQRSQRIVLQCRHGSDSPWQI